MHIDLNSSYSQQQKYDPRLKGKRLNYVANSRPSPPLWKS